MGIFDGIEAVSSNQGGQFVFPGKHRFRIKALKSPPNLRNGNCFIAELQVVSSTHEDYIEGMAVSWVRNITKHKEMALADVKNFLAAVAGCREEDIDQEGADAAVGEKQPFAGALVDCEAWNKPTQKGENFTRTLWSTAK